MTEPVFTIKPDVSASALFDEIDIRFHQAAGTLQTICHCNRLEDPIDNGLWAARELIEQAHVMVDALHERWDAMTEASSTEGQP